MKINLTKKKRMLFNWLLVIYFIYMIDPFFINSIVTVNRLVYYAFALLPLVYKFIKNARFHFDKAEKLILQCICILILWTLFMSGVVAHDLYYFSDMIKLLFKVLCGIGLFYVWKYFFEKKKITWGYEKVFSYAIILYIVVSLVFLLVPSMKEFWISFIYNDRQPMYIIKSAEYATRYGLAGWSSFGEAYMVLFGVIAIVGMYFKNQVSNIQFVVINIIMLIGTFLYGRFAMIVIILMLIMFGIYSLVIQKKIWMLNIVIACITIGGMTAVFLYNYNDSTRTVILWAFEPVLHYMDTGSFSVNSTAELKEMYKLFNPSVAEILIGVGKWYNQSGLPYGLTDVGFMRNLYFGGFAFCLFLYGLDGVISYKYAMSLKSSKSAKRIVFVMLMFVLIITDLKGSMTLNFMKFVIPLMMANKYYKRIEE